LTITNDRESLNELIEKDKMSHSNKAGKTVIGEFLRSGAPFILLLKAFSLEAPRRTLPADPSDRDPLRRNYGDPRIRWQMTKLDPNPERKIFARVGDILNTASSLLAVANVYDFFPPENVTKILISEIEWRRVVFSLAAEAPVILLFLPATSYYNLPKSLLEEIRAIELLNCKHKSIIVNAKDAPSVGELEGASPEEVFLEGILERDTEDIEKYTIELTAHVRGLGFDSVFSEQELMERPNTLLQRVSGLLNK
jgi:hypothetical protein